MKSFLLVTGTHRRGASTYSSSSWTVSILYLGFVWATQLPRASFALASATEDPVPSCSDNNVCSSPSHELQFCNFENGDNGICQSCDSITLPSECFSELGVPIGGKGGSACADTCLNLGPEKAECSANLSCEKGHSFCDFDSDDTGQCQTCDYYFDSEGSFAGGTLTACLEGNLTDAGLESCISSCKSKCTTDIYVEFSVDDSESFIQSYTNYYKEAQLNGYGLADTPIQDVPSAPLVDCTDLTLQNIHSCVNAAKNAICLVDLDRHLATTPILMLDSSTFAHLYETVWKAETNGCAAVAFFKAYEGRPLTKATFGLGLAGHKTKIPSLSISPAAGKNLLDKLVGTSTGRIAMQVKDVCDEFCTESFPCLRSNSYCDYELGVEGICSGCEDEFQSNCLWRGLPEKGIQNCAEVCGKSPDLEFGECKFCPKKVSGSNLGSVGEEAKCNFCPEEDLKYANRVMSLFGIHCGLVYEFFMVRDIPESDQNCQLAQMFNYQCGCAGPGYGGANTETKRSALVWVPRAMALLSFFGSVFIVYDVMKGTAGGAKRIFNQLMIALSAFDMLGAVGYAFTSLLTPANDYIKGSRGNDATCVAQGFLIQLGTTACYINVSLAVYYLLVIKKGWGENRMKKIRIWLFVAPIVVGLSFAFAGIPFYDNTILWCNNAAKYWAEVPVAVAIAFATFVMSFVSWDVYKKERKSSRYSMRVRASTAEQSMTSKVTWQTLFYLMAFYVTWVPYLALQYMWASGRGFTSYGFILFAGTTVPMQGFWNFLVYIRPRYLSSITNAEVLRSTLRFSFRRQSTANKFGSSNNGSSMNDVLPQTEGSRREDGTSKVNDKDKTENTEKESGMDTAFA